MALKYIYICGHTSVLEKWINKTRVSDHPLNNDQRVLQSRQKALWVLDTGQVVNEKREKAARPEINIDLFLALVQGQQGTFIRDVSTICIILNGWNPTGMGFKITEDTLLLHWWKWVSSLSKLKLTGFEAKKYICTNVSNHITIPLMMNKLPAKPLGKRSAWGNTWLCRQI